MDWYAKQIETATREMRNAVMHDPESHPLVGQTLLEAEVLISLLRRVANFQLQRMSMAERLTLLSALPEGEYEDRPEYATAYKLVRRYMAQRIAPDI